MKMYHSNKVLIFLLLFIYDNYTNNEKNTNRVVASVHRQATRHCICVQPHLCADNDNTANGDGLLDIRLADSYCSNHFEICCNLPFDSFPNSQLSVTTNSPIKDTYTKSSPPAATAPSSRSDINIYEKSECTPWIPSLSPRITSNSNIVQFGELPFSVLVLLNRKRNGSAICGGSLIHPRVVITAAHCVYESKEYKYYNYGYNLVDYDDESEGWEKETVKVRAGEWNIRSGYEPHPHQDRHVETIRIHPFYRPGVLWNDVALLVVVRPFQAAPNVGWACVARTAPPSGTHCITSGWGKNARSGHHSALPRKVSVPVVGRSRCLAALRRTRLGSAFNLHRGFMCAGGQKGKDACRGDGGGPLICATDNQGGVYVQAGIVSWGIGCGGNGTPGVYVNLVDYMEWIDEEMIAANFTISYYDY